MHCRLSIITASLNDLVPLKRTVEALSIVKILYMNIIVDGGSTDGSLSISAVLFLTFHILSC